MGRFLTSLPQPRCLSPLQFFCVNLGEFSAERVSASTYGVPPGYGDLYDLSLEGQVIDLGDLSEYPGPGTFLLEGQHDPEGHFLEYERTVENNAARVEIDLPDIGTSPYGQGCDEALDCSGFSISELDPDGNGHCRDYLRCETDEECPQSWDCVDVGTPPGDGHYPSTTFCVPPE